MKMPVIQVAGKDQSNQLLRSIYTKGFTSHLSPSKYQASISKMTQNGTLKSLNADFFDSLYIPDRDTKDEKSSMRDTNSRTRFVVTKDSFGKVLEKAPHSQTQDKNTTMGNFKTQLKQSSVVDHFKL